MTSQQAKHASKVVARFRELLGPEDSTNLGENHFAELELLIEAAIDAAVFDAEERIIGMVRNLADQIRVDAEFFNSR